MIQYSLHMQGERITTEGPMPIYSCIQLNPHTLHRENHPEIAFE